MTPIKNIRISGTGSYLPPSVLTNAEIAQRVPTSDAWIKENLGISERRIVTTELTSDLAAEAGVRALADAGITADQLGLIIVATATPDRLAPSTACIVQHKIGAGGAAAFDIAAVCSGFLFALCTAAQFVTGGSCRHALVIGADTFSKITDWTRRDCVFFGDGAGAAVISATEQDNGFLTFRLHSDGSGKWNFTVPGSACEQMPGGGSSRSAFFAMNAGAVYDTATTVLPDTIAQVLYDADLTVDDIKALIPHQPGIRILKETARKLNLPFDKVKTNMSRYANTSGGTIPILLDETLKAGGILPGDLLVFAAVGSGWTWGAALFKWT